MPYTPAGQAARGRVKNGATTLYSLPGVMLISNFGGTIAIGANTIYYLPIFVATTTTVDQLAAEQGVEEARKRGLIK